MCFLSINLCLYCTVFISCLQDVKESKLVVLFFFLCEFDVVCRVVNCICKMLPMGSPLSSFLAEAVMQDLEKRSVTNNVNIRTWVRHLGNVLATVRETKPKTKREKPLQDFSRYLYQRHVICSICKDTPHQVKAMEELNCNL